MKSYLAPIAVSLISAPEADRPVSSVIVTHSDLDLNSGSGKAEFQDRIATAVDDLCGQHSQDDASSMILIQRCRDGARDLATANLVQAIAASHINPAIGTSLICWMDASLAGRCAVSGCDVSAGRRSRRDQIDRAVRCDRAWR